MVKFVKPDFLESSEVLPYLIDLLFEEQAMLVNHQRRLKTSWEDINKMDLNRDIPTPWEVWMQTNENVFTQNIYFQQKLTYQCRGMIKGNHEYEEGKVCDNQFDQYW